MREFFSSSVANLGDDFIGCLKWQKWGLFGFVLFLSKVHGLIWLIVRDTLFVSYFGGRVDNMKCLFTMFIPGLL